MGAGAPVKGRYSGIQRRWQRRLTGGTVFGRVDIKAASEWTTKIEHARHASAVGGFLRSREVSPTSATLIVTGVDAVDGEQRRCAGQI